MSNFFIGVVLMAGAAVVYFLVRVIIAAVKKNPVEPFVKKLGIAVAVGIAGFVAFGVTQTPEERAAIQAQKEAREKAEADKGQKDVEEKTAEQKAREAAERQAAEKTRKQTEMIQEITSGWNMATTDTDNNHTNWEKATDLVKKYPDYIHNATENWVNAEDALKKPFEYYGKVVNLSGRVYSIEQLPPGNSVAKFFGGQCYHAMLALTEGYDPVTVSMYIVGDSSNVGEDSYINVKGYIYGHAKLVNRLGGGSRGIAFVGFNE
mgnify:CR=1 FL=1